MAAIIVIDGAEKAGKTTLISYVVKWLEMRGCVVGTRHWKQTEIDDREYAPALLIDSANPNLDIVIWDRSWASEYIYGKMLAREKRLAYNPWLGEILHGRIAQFCGSRFMLTTNHLSKAGILRTEDDLPVNPVLESLEFEKYAENYLWVKLYNDYTQDSLTYNGQILGHKALQLIHRRRGQKISPPFVVGNPMFQEIVISSMIDDVPDIAGGLTTATGRNALVNLGELGKAMYRKTFIEADFVTSKILREARSVLVWGSRANRYIRKNFEMEWCEHEWKTNK